MSIVPSWAKIHRAPIVKPWMLAAALAFIAAAPSWCQAQDAKNEQPPPNQDAQPQPDPKAQVPEALSVPPRYPKSSSFPTCTRSRYLTIAPPIICRW